MPALAPGVGATMADAAVARTLVRSSLREITGTRLVQEPMVASGAAGDLVARLYRRDPATALHSLAVGTYAGLTARELGLVPSQVERAYVAGVLHDIGKLRVPDRILLKPAALDDGERAIIQLHAEAGDRLLARAGASPAVRAGVRHHHERLDGTGYPERLAGEAIPLSARVVAAADVYHAMTGPRPYRTPLSAVDGVRHLHAQIGSHLDGTAVRALERVLTRHGDDFAAARGPLFGGA